MSQHTQADSSSINFDSTVKSLDLKYKDKLGIQSLSKDKKQSIIQFREEIQIKNDFRKYGESPQKIADYFTEKMELNAQFEDIVAFYEWISYQVRFNQKLVDLEESLGIELVSALMQYGFLKHDSAKKLYLLHILKILIVDYINIFEDSVFLENFDQSDIVHSLPQMLVPEQVEIVSLIMTLMNSIFWLSADSLKVILDGFEIVQKKNNHPNKFTCLANILNSTKSSILINNICSFINSMCAAYKNHFNSIAIIDDIEASGLLDLLSIQVFQKIKEGKFFIEDCSFSKEDYYGVSHEEIFFVADYDRRSHFSTPYFYRKDNDFQEFQSHLIGLFTQIYELQQKQFRELDKIN